MQDAEIRSQMVTACRRLDAEGLNRGSSGNVSVRVGGDMLITPSGVGYDDLSPDMMGRMQIANDAELCDGPLKQSSEWRFHRDLLRARPEFGAVVHTHAPFCTILAIARKPIPAIHYMMAAFGGPDIRVADYATYGTADLSAHVVTAMEGRNGCLLANHGMIVAGPDLTRAMWLAGELEALAHQYYHVLTLGGGHVLSDAQIADTAKSFETYGIRSKD